jgi:hypothetical protein
MRLELLLRVTCLGLLAAPVARAAGPTARQCVAANEAAVKLSGESKLRAAREQLLVCAAPSCPKVVRAECTRQVDELNALLPTVVFAVKTSRGQDVTDVKVTMDTEVVATALDGTVLTVEPGSHAVTFEVAGEAPVTQTFVFREGEKARRETIVVGAPVPSPTPPVMPPAPPAPESSSGTLRTMGIVTTAVGGAGLATGVILGSFAASAWSTAKSACPAEADCSAAAVSDSQKASTLATGSTVALIVGGALAGGGVVMFLLAPRSGTSPTPVKVGLDLALGRLAVRGEF